MNKETPPLKIGTAWVDLVITNEPIVMTTFRGYVPVLPVRVKKTGLNYYMYISAKSIAEGLEPLRKANKERFSGLNISIRKASEDKFAAYEIVEQK